MYLWQSLCFSLLTNLHSSPIWYTTKSPLRSYHGDVWREPHIGFAYERSKKITRNRNVFKKCGLTKVLVQHRNTWHSRWQPFCVWTFYMFCSRVAQLCKALHLSARAITTVPGSNPGCITSGHDWKSHRAAHNWPSVWLGVSGHCK
jgi:hypothetical protein